MVDEDHALYAALMGHGVGYDLEDLFVTSPPWHRFAACRGVGPALFFPERGESTAPAKALCEDCPVTAECAAAGQHERAGIWAGTSPKARRLIRSSGHTRPPRRPAA